MVNIIETVIGGVIAGIVVTAILAHARTHPPTVGATLVVARYVPSAQPP